MLGKVATKDPEDEVGGSIVESGPEVGAEVATMGSKKVRNAADVGA